MTNQLTITDEMRKAALDVANMAVAMLGNRFTNPGAAPSNLRVHTVTTTLFDLTRSANPALFPGSQATEPLHLWRMRRDSAKDAVAKEIDALIRDEAAKAGIDPSNINAVMPQFGPPNQVGRSGKP